MSNETIETIRGLLEAALAETDDTDVSFKLRTALQLLDAQENDVKQLQEVADDDADLRQRLIDLGYLD
ncbi:MAG: hypothetical protein ACQETB_06180 [Halobacteriota archaeon]